MSRGQALAGLDEQEVQTIIRLADYAIDRLKSWMTPEEYRIVTDLQERMLNEAIRLNNEKSIARARGEIE